MRYQVAEIYFNRIDSMQVRTVATAAIGTIPASPPVLLLETQAYMKLSRHVEIKGFSIVLYYLD